MRGYAMKVVATVGRVADACGYAEGQYVKGYDLDAFDGRGDVLLTRRLEEAQLWPTAQALYRAWMATSTVRPLRADGQPNRPLTAFSVEAVPVG